MSAREEKAPAARAARACDSCHGRGARWYCAADDAFLCNACDASVHSANPLARRHERVRLKPAREERPAWHHGCKRKARSPRGPHRGPRPGHDDAPVPDVLASPAAPAAEEAQLLYRVPVLDPVLAGFYSSPALDDDWKPPVFPAGMQPPAAGFPVQPDLDLLGFEIDVGSLLGDAIDGDAFCLEFLEQSESHGDSGSGGTFFPVKEEEMEDNEGSSAVTKSDVSFGCGGEELDEKPEIAAKRRRIMLSLNYDAVISAWSAQACPWADGARPQLDPDECWLDYTGMVWGTKVEGEQEEPVEACSGGGSRRANEYALVSSAGREARVSRYREKRRTRLFSKKIRYEVRKLNAEKRPRMKGRFVKRSSFAEGAAGMPAARAQPQFAF